LITKVILFGAYIIEYTIQNFFKHKFGANSQMGLENYDYSIWLCCIFISENPKKRRMKLIVDLSL